ncbi:hypothetical protein [Sunxiuqinia indica]|uniref:hypothetical protein n=1 Tax=Sunxiuqinia indica TaxID=2692584 RepID=UPI00135A208C|nr:hypothetical protein [Sunxiuqinia indica]
MTEEEKKVLLDIGSLYKELLNEPYGKWNGRHKEEPSAYSYCRNAESLKNQVYELFNTFHPDYLSENQLGDFSHTCDKEVKNVEHIYERAIKRNAAKMRHTEFLQAIHNANKQIKSDLYSVFSKIKEIPK